jgi:hypothetical protein
LIPPLAGDLPGTSITQMKNDEKEYLHKNIRRQINDQDYFSIWYCLLSLIGES